MQAETTTPKPLPLAVDAKEARRLLGIGRTALWELTASGKIPHLRAGRKILYRVAALNDWLLERESEARK